MDGPNIDQGAARTAAALRVQLAQMTAATQVLERSAADEKSKRYLAALEQSICRMLRIVGRLELTERLGGETARLEPSLIDLAQLTRDLGERLGQLLAYAGVELTVNTPDWMGALADDSLIRQMLMELVSNGAKAGRHVTLTLTQRDQRAIFTVEDDGPGMFSSRLAHLFTSEEESVPDWHRSGVGVAIARRAADLHGGTVMAECVPGKGLKVIASIPLGTPGGRVFETPRLSWNRGGFDEELIALSDQLPPEAFDTGSE